MAYATWVIQFVALGYRSNKLHIHGTMNGNATSFEFGSGIPVGLDIPSPQPTAVGVDPEVVKQGHQDNNLSAPLALGASDAMESRDLSEGFRPNRPPTEARMAADSLATCHAGFFVVR